MIYRVPIPYIQHIFEQMCLGMSFRTCIFLVYKGFLRLPELVWLWKVKLPKYQAMRNKITCLTQLQGWCACSVPNQTSKEYHNQTNCTYKVSKDSTIKATLQGQKERTGKQYSQPSWAKGCKLIKELKIETSKWI